MFNDPLLFAAMAAERRAALQRAASPWLAMRTNTGRRRLRRLVAAVVRGVRPRPQLSRRDELVGLDDLQRELEAIPTTRPHPGSDFVVLDVPLEQAQEELDLVSVPA